MRQVLARLTDWVSFQVMETEQVHATVTNGQHVAQGDFRTLLR